MARNNYSFDKRKKELAKKDKKEEKRLRKLERNKIKQKESIDIQEIKDDFQS